MTGGQPLGPVHRQGGGTPAWVKLWSLVILVNLAGFLVSIWVARLVRAVPDTTGTETALMFGYYAAMAAAAFMDALLLDELVFKGAFRRTHLLGRSSEFVRDHDSVADVAVTLQRSTFTFPVLLVLTGTLTYLGFNLVNNDFDRYHRHVGKHISALHQGDAPAQIEAISQLSIRREHEVVPALVRGLGHEGDPSRWAAWALGRFGDLPTRRHIYRALLAAAGSEHLGLRREAMVALGRLQYRDIAPGLQAELRAELEAGDAIDLRLLYGLGAIQDISSIPLLTDLLHKGNPEAQRMAAWSLAQHRDQDPCGGRSLTPLGAELQELCTQPWAREGGVGAVRILEERLPTAGPALRCAIVHSLGILAHERSNLALMRAYDDADAAGRTARCPSIGLSMRPDGDLSDRIDLLQPEESFALKIVLSMAQMRATSPEIRRHVEPWLRARIDDETREADFRESARALLDGIEQGRDDRQAKSVDEALGIAPPD